MQKPGLDVLGGTTLKFEGVSVRVSDRFFITNLPEDVVEELSELGCREVVTIGETVVLSLFNKRHQEQLIVVLPPDAPELWEQFPLLRAWTWDC